MHTAQMAHVSGEQIAKGVLLKDNAGYLLAVVPAARHVMLGYLQDQLGRELKTASEDELVDVFNDCEIGAVPALGAAYDVDTVIDPLLFEHHDVYFEGGDHEDLVHLAGADFEELMEDADLLSCSSHRM
jgi:Ala-tRNA(Pro) deacylase